MSRNNLIFEEVAKFDTKLISIIAIMAIGIVIIVKIVYLKNCGNRFFIPVLVVTVLISALLATASIKTSYSTEGVSYQLFPLQLTKSFIPWKDVKSIEMIHYNPDEFGGWGIRKNKAGIVAYVVSGKWGILFHLKNGSKILLGVRNYTKLNEFFVQNKEKGFPSFMLNQ